jgi:hypothetical protein
VRGFCLLENYLLQTTGGIVGKRRKRLTMAKYAKKYATIREALFGKKVEPSPIEVEPVVEQLKAEEVVVEPKVEAKPKPKPKAKKAPAKKKATSKKRTSRKKKEE